MAFSGNSAPFGQSSSATGSLFGIPSSAKPVGSTSSLFGSNPTNSPFGAPSGLPSSTTPQTSPSKPSLFGNASTFTSGTLNTSAPSGGFNSNLFAPKPNSASPAAAVPSPKFSFSAASTSQPSKDGAPSNPPSLFPPASNALNTGTAAASKPSESPSGNQPPPLFGTPTSAPASAPATASGLFSSAPLSAPSIFASAPAKSTSSVELPKPASSSIGGGGLFGAKSTVPIKSSPLAGAPTVPGNSPTSAPSQSSPQPSSTHATLTASKAAATPAPSLLRGKTLEDLVSRWNSELADRVSDFKHTANEIAAWDQVLIQNGDQISMLHEELQRIDPIQSSIDNTLDFVETQQAELSAALDDYERQLSNQPQDFSAAVHRTTAAQEREQAYRTAEQVHGQLDEMAGSLSTMIAELNSMAQPQRQDDIDGVGVGEDPIVQIGSILNAHLSSLIKINEHTQDLTSKVSELEGRVANTKVEFGLEPHQIPAGPEEASGGPIGVRTPHYLLPPRR